MPDEDLPVPQQAASSRTLGVTSKATGFALPGLALRRSKTLLDDGPPPPRQKSQSEASFDGSPQAGVPRRSSNFSDYNLDEAHNLLNPSVNAGLELPAPETSSLASLSLAFALLPALAGALFKNGHSVVTDVMLLGLSGVFLHWSVTQPWVWYHSAQQVRMRQEADPEIAVKEDLDTDESGPPDAGYKTAASLNDVPEESDSDQMPRQNGKPIPREKTCTALTISQQQSALRELYLHEVLALLSCFALPLLSAYLLHHIRVQLSRPSEGLVSNYNLTIFVLVSELRAFSHTIKLVKARTLHLQRVVHANPFTLPTQSGAHIEEVLERLERLEARSLADEFVREHSEDMSSVVCKEKKASVIRDVRNAISPDLDALNRAVRRYEKKAMLLQHQTDARFSALDSRLADAIALAAVAAKNSSPESSSYKNILVRAVEQAIAVALFPFNAFLRMLMFPLRSIYGLFNRLAKRPMVTKPSRSSRAGKQPSLQSRYGGERVLSRVAKR